MKKIVVNMCFGGFDLSQEGCELYAKKMGKTLYSYKMKDKSNFKNTIYVRGTDGFITRRFLKDKGDSFIWGEKNDSGYFSASDLKRDDPLLVEVVEELKEKASGKYGNLKITEIPDNVEWEIEEYDGQEWVAEKHETW